MFQDSIKHIFALNKLVKTLGLLVSKIPADLIQDLGKKHQRQNAIAQKTQQ